MTDLQKRSLLGWFEAVLPRSRWDELEPRSKAQIYTLRVVIWMMLQQRLNHCGSQQQAVDQMAEGPAERLLPASKRVREGKISQNTGAYYYSCR